MERCGEKKERRGSEQGRKEKQRSKGLFLLSFIHFHSVSLCFSPPLLLSWELSFELLELLGGAVSVYQFVSVCVGACMCVGGGKLSRCIRNKRAGKISESTMRCCASVWAHLHTCMWPCVCLRACVWQRKRGSTIKLSTWGICQGKQHSESHLMCKWIHSLMHIESNMQTHANAQTHCWIMLIFVNSIRHSAANMRLIVSWFEVKKWLLKNRKPSKA